MSQFESMLAAFDETEEEVKQSAIDEMLSNLMPKGDNTDWIEETDSIENWTITADNNLTTEEEAFGEKVDDPFEEFNLNEDYSKVELDFEENPLPLPSDFPKEQPNKVEEQIVSEVEEVAEKQIIEAATNEKTEDINGLYKYDGHSQQNEIKATKEKCKEQSLEAEKVAKGKGRFNSVFSNQDQMLMLYLLNQLKDNGEIKEKSTDIQSAMLFHSIARGFMDRKNPWSDSYMSCYIGFKTWKAMGFKYEKAKRSTQLLIKIGYMKKVVVNKTKTYYYPLLSRSNDAEFLPNATFKEAFEYFGMSYNPSEGYEI